MKLLFPLCNADPMEIDCEPMDIPGWPEITAVVHRSPVYPETWTVSCRRCRKSLSYLSRTRKKAAQSAADRMNDLMKSRGVNREQVLKWYELEATADTI